MRPSFAPSPRTVTADGSAQQQVSISSNYGESTAYAYAAGKAKFSQAVNGVQTWHDYEATTEHSTAHKHTVTIKADGELVAVQSRKTESFIAADDTTVFVQEFNWDGENWLQLNTAKYEYDEEKRVIKTIRGNGRFSTASWMCCGKLRVMSDNAFSRLIPSKFCELFYQQSFFHCDNGLFCTMLCWNRAVLLLLVYSF